MLGQQYVDADRVEYEATDDVIDRSMNQLKGLLAVSTALVDVVTPEQIQGIMRLVGRLGEMADRISGSQIATLIDFEMANHDAMISLLERVMRLERGGALERVEQIANLIVSALDALTPAILISLVTKMARGMEMADTASQLEIIKRLPDMLYQLNDLVVRPPVHKQKSEALRLVKAMKDPEVQDGLELMIELLKKVGRYCEANHVSESES